MKVVYLVQWESDDILFAKFAQKMLITSDVNKACEFYNQIAVNLDRVKPEHLTPLSKKVVMCGGLQVSIIPLPLFTEEEGPNPELFVFPKMED